MNNIWKATVRTPITKSKLIYLTEYTSIYYILILVLPKRDHECVGVCLFSILINVNADQGTLHNVPSTYYPLISFQVPCFWYNSLISLLFECLYTVIRYSDSPSTVSGLLFSFPPPFLFSLPSVYFGICWFHLVKISAYLKDISLDQKPLAIFPSLFFLSCLFFCLRIWNSVPA